MKQPKTCPRCDSPHVNITPVKRYEPSIEDPDDADIHPFHTHYLVDCKLCHRITEYYDHPPIGPLVP